MNIKKIYCLIFFMLFFLNSSSSDRSTTYNKTSATKKYYKDIRHFLYNKGDLSSIKNIKENKKFYEFIIQAHMRHLLKKKSQYVHINPLLAIPTVIFPAAVSLFCGYGVFICKVDQCNSLKNMTILNAILALNNTCGLLCLNSILDTKLIAKLELDKAILYALEMV